MDNGQFLASMGVARLYLFIMQQYQETGTINQISLTAAARALKNERPPSVQNLLLLESALQTLINDSDTPINVTLKPFYEEFLEVATRARLMESISLGLGIGE